MSRDEQVEARARELVMAAYAEAGMQPQPWFLHDDPASFRGSDYFLFKAIIEALRGASGGGVDARAGDGALLPCPFCGSYPNPDPQNDDCPLPGSYGKDPVAYYQTIWCEQCGAESGKRTTEAEAIAAWNTRTPDRPAENAKSSGEVRAAAQALVEALAKVSPITTRDTPDYAEVQFGEHQTQAMTMVPNDWQAIESTYLDLRAALARSGKGE